VSWRYIHASEEEVHNMSDKESTPQKGSLFSNLHQVPKSLSNISANRPVFIDLHYNILKDL
jgi:hypothetical protein